MAVRFIRGQGAVMPPGSAPPGGGGWQPIPPPPSGQQSSTTGVALDPYLFPPANSTTILAAGEVASVGAGNLVQIPLTPAVQLNQTNIGVISSVLLLLDQILISSQVFWQLFVNNNAVPGYAGWTILGRSGAASVSSDISPLRLPIPPGGNVTVQALNVDGSPYTIGVQLFGWFWPSLS